MLSYAKTCENEYVTVELEQTSMSEVIAREYQYHRSCYKKITRKPKEKSEEEIREMAGYEKCFDKCFVKEHIICNGEVMKVSQLSSVYADLQEREEVAVKGASNRLIKLRLKNFGDSVSFFRNNTETSCELIYSNNPVAEHKKVHTTLSTERENVEKVAKLLRNEINSHEGAFNSWPPTSEDLVKDDLMMPHLLELFLRTLFSKNKVVSARVDRLVKSIGQDIIYNNSRGKVKTLKHTQLGLILKRKTGSKQIINYVNRLGHCISYDEVNMIETAVADEQMKKQMYLSYVPNNVQPSVFVTFVYDNCDHNPETLSGVSMHCTNGIIVQRTAPQHIMQHTTVETVNQRIGKIRSFAAVTRELDAYYTPSVKVNPPTISNVQSNTNMIYQLISKKSDFLWLIARYVNGARIVEQQKVPGWTGFHNEVTNTIDPGLHFVDYLPAIDGSPTKMETVQEILMQIKMKSEKLGLSCADAVFDHAIYAKALEVITNPLLSPA